MAVQTGGRVRVIRPGGRVPDECSGAMMREAESGIYIISGQARFYTGGRLETAHDARAGDLIRVAPHVVHLEMNPSKTEPVKMVVSRSTRDRLTFNLPTPDGWSPPA